MSPVQFYHLKGTLMPLRFDLRGGLNTVGRNPTNDVVIHEASVSAFHAEINVDPDAVIVRDLESTNGTFIDDQPVSEHEIRSGQVVQFGSVALRILTDDFRIAVPHLPTPSPEDPAPKQLASGVLACTRKPHLQATHRCRKCARPFHIGSVRVVRLSGGPATMIFCPECSGQMEEIPGVDPTAAGRGGILARLSQTIHLGVRRPKP